MPSKVTILFLSNQKAPACSLPVYRIERESETDIPTGEFINMCCGVEVNCTWMLSSLSDAKSIPLNSGAIWRFVLTDDINKVLRRIETEYICIVQQGIQIISENWLSNLIFNCELINNSGVIGISTDTSQQSPFFLPNKEDESSIVFSPENGIVDGIVLFKTKLLYDPVGAFGTDLDGWEIPHFCQRASRYGFENYYIDNEFAILKESLKRGSDEKMKTSLEEMKKNKNWYLPL